MSSSALFSPKKRMILGGTCIFLALILIVGVCTIPFVFESSSIYYKFGIHKTLLRTGKVFGIIAATLIFFQVLLVSRLKILDRIFSLNQMYRCHRMSGMIIAFLTLMHPILILASENFTLFPSEIRYWPELLGAVVWVFIVMLFITAYWRLIFGFAYDKWLRFHRLVTILSIVLLTIHILFVSDTFKSGLPQALVFVAASITLLLISRLWYWRLFPGKRRFVVSDVENVGQDAYAVKVKPGNGQMLKYIPGQFAFITPVSENLPKEEHPFTISSSPSRPDALQFVIRSQGDWTRKIHRLKAGDPVFIDGPYGHFSHRICTGNDPMIMIAGGIGITPMLSMLRYMADRDDQRQILLIWSNKAKKYIVFPEEFKHLECVLQGLKINHVITRGRSGGHEKGRLDETKLESLLEGFSRKSIVFICGPFKMMKEISRNVKKIGFSSGRVYKEEFGL
jgi:predicted ferric reductase